MDSSLTRKTDGEQLPSGNRPTADVDTGHIQRVERLATWLDDLIRIPILNIRIGLDPLIGLIPGVGDVITAIISISILIEAMKRRLPRIIIFRMVFNIAFDFLMGMLPVAGDVADVFIKSNRWNLSLLRKNEGEGRAAGLSDYLIVWGVIIMLLALKIFLIFMVIRVLSTRSWF